MLNVNQQGYISHSRIDRAICPHIERGTLSTIRGIIVHQTGGANSASTFNSYAKPKAMGAHFLIDQDGKIYQTASLFKQTMHVGRLRARCIVEHRCTPVEIQSLKKFNPAAQNRREMAKSVPERYPSNQDSIGIEIVGAFRVPKGKDAGEYGVYDTVNQKQNDALRWLVQELASTFSIPMTEVFPHPVVAFKNRTEAASAAW